jgi:hypothetical protein
MSTFLYWISFISCDTETLRFISPKKDNGMLLAIKGAYMKFHLTTLANGRKDHDKA